MRDLASSIVEEFEGAPLGDKRLNARLESVAALLHARPDVSFPRAMPTEAELEGFYRLIRNEKVTADAVVEPHLQATVRRIEQRKVVLAISDTSEIAYRGDRGLGALHRTGKGFLAHVTLAVAADEGREVLGALGLEAWTRKSPSPTSLVKQGKISYAESRKLPREQDRWWRSICNVSERVADKSKIIHVADSEADDYDLIANLVEGKHRFVIRLGYDRPLADLDGLKTREFLATRKVVCTREVHLSKRKRGPKGRSKSKRHEARKERDATLAISAASVQLKRPNYSTHDLTEAAVNVVSVREKNPPQGEEGVEWLLFTTEPIETETQLLSVVDYYCARWLIEEYFKALKTGCSLEKRELDSFKTLSVALALFLPVAWSLLRLRTISRAYPNAPASHVLTPLQLAVLRHCASKPLPRWPTVKDVTQAIASLGGHIRNNGDPGWLVLARGYHDLLIMVSGYLLSTNSLRNEINR